MAQFNVNLAFSADTGKAKAQIQELQLLLNKIAYTGSTKTSLTTGIEEAATAAKQLQFHLNNAFNATTGKFDLSLLDRSLKTSNSSIRDLSLSLLGITSAFICAVVIDKLFLGESQAFIAHIVSEKYELINEAIIQQLDRTSTILDGTGGYSKTEKKVVMVSFSMREYSALINIVNKIDKTAFMSVSRAHEINGEGWSRPSPDPEKE